jgi:single-strand DNA-binding protein
MLNRANLIGRLGNDPELKNLPSGSAVCNFSVATTEYFVKDGNKQEKTEWHRIVCFSKLAENCSKYLKKGKLVYIDGKIQTRSWDKDGQKHYATEIVANDVKFLSFDSKPDDKKTEKKEQKSSDPFNDIDPAHQVDDLPF